MEKFTGSLGEEVFALLWCLTSYGTVEEFSSSTRYEFVEGTVRDTLQPYFSENEEDLRAICESFKAKYKSNPAACEFADEFMRVLKDRHDPVELFKPLPS